jgi:hypothetical protein
MELDEMKLAWSDMSVQLEQQKKLTDDIILKMTQEKSSSRLGRIIAAETFGVLISFAGLFYVASNFYKFDNWLETTGGIGTILLMLLGIVFGFRIIRQANRIDLTKHDLKTTLSYFKAFKSTLGFYKRLSIVSNIVGPLFVFPATFALFTDIDLLENPAAAGFGLIAAIFVVPIVLWLVFKFYKKNIGAVNTAFNDLNDNN